MSLFSTLNTGASGLGVQSSALSVIGDNIANISTTGYKGSRASFADYMPQSTSTLAGAGTIGSGSGLNSIATLFGQGSLTSTSSATDMAVSGAGFFMVQDGNETFYTRAGEFYLDEDGFLVNASGYNVQGYTATDGTLSTSVDDLQISTEPASAQATENVIIDLVLNSETAVDTTLQGYIAGSDFDGNTVSWDDAITDDMFTTSITIYDEMGESHEVTVAFENNGSGTWSWCAMVDGAEMGQTEDMVYELASGECTFASDGSLSAFTMTSVVSGSPGLTWSNGALLDEVTFDFGLDASTGDVTEGSITVSGTDSAVSTMSQDGYPLGELTDISVATDGVITGTYTNGEQIILGQMVLATFTSESGLERMGSNLFRATSASGDPAVGAPGSGGRGDLYSYALEASNVELEDEFVNMITSQRGYQAAARVISTADETLQELVNLV
jgi:flagellar hook protein FlgE